MQLSDTYQKTGIPSERRFVRHLSDREGLTFHQNPCENNVETNRLNKSIEVMSVCTRQ